MSDKAYVMLNWEMDWDQDTVYFHVTEDGKIVKYDILTDTLYEYHMERVAN